MPIRMPEEQRGKTQERKDGSERSYVLTHVVACLGVVIAVLAGGYNVLAEPLTTSASMVTALGTALLLIASVWASARYVRQRALRSRTMQTPQYLKRGDS